MDTRRDAAKIIGDYLLKGYTLLDSYCRECSTPLMKLRNGDTFCVLCSDSTTSPLTGDVTHNSPLNSEFIVHAEKKKLESSVSETRNNQLKTTEHPDALQIVRRKLNWAVDKLDKCESVSECIQLCALIKACSDTIKVINETNTETSQKVNGSIDD